MNPTLRVVVSWLFLAAGISSMALGYGPWIFVLTLGISHVLRHTLKPRIPDISQRGRPVLSLSLFIAMVITITVIRLFFPENSVARAISWCIAVPLVLYFMSDDIRVSRELRKNAE